MTPNKLGIRMKTKQYHLLRTYLYGASALFILSLTVWTKINETEYGLVLVVLIAAVYSYLSYRHFKKIKETNEDEMMYAPQMDATKEEQIKYYKRCIYLGLVSFSLLTLATTISLNDLVSGNKERVELFAPVSFVYKQFGYDSAVLSVPILGVIVILLLVRKINIIKSIV